VRGLGGGGGWGGGGGGPDEVSEEWRQGKGGIKGGKERREGPFVPRLRPEGKGKSSGGCGD